MAGYRDFAKNVGLLTIANFGTKILSFLLVPLYTSVLSTAEYGTYDLVTNTISLLIPILTQNITDAVLRFSMDDDLKKEEVLAVGLKHFSISLGPVALIIFVNHLGGFFPELDGFALLIFALYISQALSGILLYYVRGLGRFGDVAVSSVICSALIIACNIIFLLPLELGLAGYFLANIIGPLVQTLYLLLRLHGNSMKLGKWDRALEKEMLEYSRPLIANNVAWWVNNVSDRYIVTFFCGIAVNGIYSVASKIPSVLSVVQNIVGQAWTISAVSEYDPEDSNGFFSNMYAGYNCVMTTACSLIIACNLILARILYANDFYSAWQYAPFLTISVVFGALAGYIGGILAAVKDSGEFAKSSVIGALVNLGLNLLTVPVVGPMGAAVATLLCYWVTWFLRVRTIKKYIRLRIKLIRDYVSYGILILQGSLFVLISNSVIVHLLEAGLFLLVLVLYRSEFKAIIGKSISAIKVGNGGRSND